jgi:hypothetical protein
MLSQTGARMDCTYHHGQEDMMRMPQPLMRTQSISPLNGTIQQHSTRGWRLGGVQAFGQSAESSKNQVRPMFADHFRPCFPFSHSTLTICARLEAHTRRLFPGEPPCVGANGKTNIARDCCQLNAFVEGAGTLQAVCMTCSHPKQFNRPHST